MTTESQMPPWASHTVGNTTNYTDLIDEALIFRAPAVLPDCLFFLEREHFNLSRQIQTRGMQQLQNTAEAAS